MYLHLYFAQGVKDHSGHKGHKGDFAYNSMRYLFKVVHQLHKVDVMDKLYTFSYFFSNF